MSPHFYYRELSILKLCRGMDGSKIVKNDSKLKLEHSYCHYSKVAVAISGSKKSKYIVSWALDKFVPEGIVFVKLIHVRPKISAVPTASKLCLIYF